MNADVGHTGAKGATGADGSTGAEIVRIGGVDVPTTITPLRRADPHLDLETYEPDADLLSLNMGPQHPSTHGVLRIKLFLDGEVCIKAVPYLGYLHRGKEKLCEKLTYVQLTAIIDKTDYVSPMTSELALNMAFEELLELELPKRATWLRTLLAELQRVASHLLWFGTFGLDMGGALGGGSTLFLHCFRERELILDLFEELTGCRFHYNTHTVGGNRHDAPVGWDGKVHQALDFIERRVAEYRDYCENNAIFRARTVGVGVVDPTLAMEIGAGGPILRASGVDFDLRRDAPYMAYGELDLNVPVRESGDCYARFEVRIAELLESIRLARMLIDGLPEGAINASKAVKLPTSIKFKDRRVGYTAIESPRGELGTYVETQKGANPYRCKIRPPSLHACALLPYLAPGATVPDIVVTLGSLDPIMGEVDR